jgi:hypothetical protein
MSGLPRSQENSASDPEAILDVEHCSGCREDFYNDKNPLGVKQCWMRKSAKLAPSVLIHIDQVPPYRNLKPKDRPTCYKAERHVTVKPEAIGSDGYWKS